MSQKPSDNIMIPADTVRVAGDIYPKGDNLWIKMRDELGSMYRYTVSLSGWQQRPKLDWLVWSGLVSYQAEPLPEFLEEDYDNRSFCFASKCPSLA